MSEVVYLEQNGKPMEYKNLAEEPQIDPVYVAVKSLWMAWEDVRTLGPGKLADLVMVQNGEPLKVETLLDAMRIDMEWKKRTIEGERVARLRLRRGK